MKKKSFKFIFSKKKIYKLFINFKFSISINNRKGALSLNAYVAQKEMWKKKLNKWEDNFFLLGKDSLIKYYIYYKNLKFLNQLILSGFF